MTLENVDDVYPLTPLQEGMLFHSISAPGTGVFIQQVVSRLEGRMDAAQFEQCWSALVAKYAALRSAFLWDGLDEPLQVVRTSVDTSWKHEDWRDSDDQEARLAATLADDRIQDFDLAQAPLSRMRVIQIDDREWTWIWTFHHIQCDGWSTHLLLREFWERYHGRGSSDLESLPFREYLSWIANQDQNATDRYWASHLDGFESTTTPNLFVESESAGSNSHAQQTHALPSELTTQIDTFARSHRLTLNTVVQGAWALCLSRYAGSNDVVFGVTVSGRPPELTGAEEAVGCFINTLPARISLRDGQPLVAWLTALQNNQRQQRDYEHSSLAKLHKHTELASQEALFDTILVFENYPAPPKSPEQCELRVTKQEFHEQSNYPLALLVVPGPKLNFILVHDLQKVDVPAAKQMLQRMQHMLEEMVSHPEQSIHEFSLATRLEQEAVLAPAACGDSSAQACLHELFESRVKETPNQVALEFASESLTYRALNELANGIALRLQQRGIKPSEHVGLCVDRSPEMIAAILGILKSGAAYVPLNPQWPQDHLEFVISDAELSHTLVSEHLHDRVPIDKAVLLSRDAKRDVKPTAVTSQATPDHAAYVIYTSGSTGRPKGVSIKHQNIVASTLARGDFYSEAPSKFLLLSSFAFDSSMAGIFWTLSTGGTLVLPQTDGEKDLHYLREIIQAKGITHTLCLPSLYELLLHDAQPGELESLRAVIVAGESCPAQLYALHTQNAGNARLYNEYGPTEATVWCSVHEVTDQDRTVVPIGKPTACSQLYILDQNRGLLPPGVVGELYVGGRGVAEGYLNQPELTAKHFLSNPFADGLMYRTGDLACLRNDGNLIFQGRADRQVKIRGHRVEPDELEHILRSHPQIREAAVVVRGQQGDISPEALARQLDDLPTSVANELLLNVELNTDGTTKHQGESL